MMSELKECPFCGDDDCVINYKNNGTGSQYDPEFQGVCNCCGTVSGIYSTREKLIDAWNTRAMKFHVDDFSARPWTDQEKKDLEVALAKVFNWRIEAS
jgi:Lar family restriction alleviation protein